MGSGQSFTPIYTLPGQPGRVAWGDYDNDGDLDVFVGKYRLPAQLLKNNLKESGTVSFTDVSSSVGLLPDIASVSSLHWIDADNDGDVDLYVVNTKENVPQLLTRDLFYKNVLVETGTASFVEASGAVRLHTWTIESGNGLFGDYDNDGDQDLYVSTGIFTHNLFYHNNLVETGSLSFTEIAGSLGVQQPIHGGIDHWGDLDNDGDLDLLAGLPSERQSWYLYKNLLVEPGTEGFIDFTSAAGLSGVREQSALIFFDMDNDGDLDIYAGKHNPGFNRLFRNNLDGGTWLALKLVGTNSNRDGIGTRIKLVAGGRTQYRQHTVPSSRSTGNQSHRVHFGLGGAETVDELKIYWPSGCVQTLTDIAANQILEVTESCVKDISGVDRITETPIFDVFAGDIFTYTIEIENPFEEVYFRISDTLDAALDYVLGSFTVDGTPAGDDAFATGDLLYDTDRLLDAGETLSLSFQVEVQDVPVGYLIDNTAQIMACKDLQDIAGTRVAAFEAIAPQVHVVPEPSTLFLVSTGLIGILMLVRRKIRKR